MSKIFLQKLICETACGHDGNINNLIKLIKIAKKPKKFNEPEHKVQSLKEIWLGKELNKVRGFHLNNNVNGLDVCKECTFKDTYSWRKIN